MADCLIVYDKSNYGSTTIAMVSNDLSDSCTIAFDPPNARLHLSFADLRVDGNVEPNVDDTYYVGKDDDDDPRAWKGIISKDQAGTGKYYRLEVYNDALRIVDLTD